MDRISRLLGNVFALPAPSSNGRGVKTLAPAPAEQKATAEQAAASAISTSAAWFAPADFIPIDGRQGTLELRDGYRAYATSVLCHAAMRYRATKIAEAPLFVADETAEGEPWLPDHPLATLLQYPNDDEEMADLLEATSYALDSTGLALWVIDRDNAGRPGRLSGYSGDEFSVRPTEARIYGEFLLSTSRGQKRVQPEDAVFFRLPHPSDRWAGLAPVHVVARQLGLEAKLLRSMVAGLNNAVGAGASLEFPPDFQLQPDQVDEFRERVAAQYAAARNHGKLFISNGTLVKHTLGFAGLEGGALYREIEAAVCVAFGVRPEILGMMIGLENAPWSHMQTAQRLSYDETIIPLWRRFERAITRQLLRPTDEDASHLVKFDTAKIRALQADATEQARRSVLVRGIATRNQRRQIAGLEPMEDDPAFWDAVEERGVGVLPTEAEGAMPKGARPGRVERKASEGEDERWALFDAVARAGEFAWEMAAAEQLQADQAVALRLAEETLRTARKDDDPLAPADPESVRALVEAITQHMDMAAATQWRSRLGPLTQATARQAAERVAAELGLSFDLLQPGLLEYVQREAAWLVTQVTDTTKQAIREALSAGVLEGEGIPALTERIRESGAFAPSRAELIARTETTRVYNGAQRETLAAYQAESGERITKTWLATPDGRTRDSHRALNGETRGIDEPFSNGLQAPGEPNCRCTMVYAMEDA